ncbi:MAG: tripartite tricarboxylate transporter substrate binding protein [Pseudomonadota bacterium]
MKHSLPTVTRRGVLTLAAAAALPSAWAQGYPDKPITWVCPYPAGSASDVTARQFANEFAKVIKQPVIMMNKVGAGGLVGTKFVAMAPPDGYTLLVGAIGTHVFNPVINKSTNYDPIKDFEPVSRIVSFPNVLVVSSALGVNTVAEFVAMAKSRANKPMTYGTAGNGTTSHIAAAQFENLSGAKFLGVNYSGTPAAMTEVLAGRVDFVFGNINVVLPYVRTGALKALAIASDKRYALMPTTPTFSEVRMPEMEMSVWSGLFLPAGTPRAIAAQLNDAVKAVAKTNVLQPIYESAGATLEVDNSPEDFARLIQADTKKWVPVVKAMGVQVQ